MTCLWRKSLLAAIIGMSAVIWASTGLGQEPAVPAVPAVDPAPAVEPVKDAVEPVKDAAEPVKDAARDATDTAKDAVKDAKDAAELVAVRTHAEKIKISKYNCVDDTVSGREGRVTQGKAKCDETKRNTTDGNTNTGMSAIGAGPSPPIRRFFNSGSGPLVSSGAARRIERQRS